jgi:hypothetical protein
MKGSQLTAPTSSELADRVPGSDSDRELSQPKTKTSAPQARSA